jgi:hypothetical protein
LVHANARIRDREFDPLRTLSCAGAFAGILIEGMTQSFWRLKCSAAGFFIEALFRAAAPVGLREKSEKRTGMR